MKECTIDTVILNLQKLKKWEINLKIFSEENEKLRIETQALRQKNKELESEIELIERESVLIQEDYNELIYFMNKAHEMLINGERTSTEENCRKLHGDW